MTQVTLSLPIGSKGSLPPPLASLPSASGEARAAGPPSVWLAQPSDGWLLLSLDELADLMRARPTMSFETKLATPGLTWVRRSKFKPSNS